jgi:hypothetical protein
MVSLITQLVSKEARKAPPWQETKMPKYSEGPVLEEGGGRHS